MPRLSQAQELSRRRIADLAARGLSPEALGRQLLTALDLAIPTDGGRLFGLDPDTLLINRLLAGTNDDGWARREWLRDIYLAPHPLTYLEPSSLMRAGLPVVAFQERQEHCWGYPAAVLGSVPTNDHLRWFHELACPVGGTISATFAAGGRWIAALQIYRREGAHPFQPGEVAFLRRMAPAIGSALGAALTRERVMAEEREAGPAASGILVLSQGNVVQLSTPAAEAWCALLRDADRLGHGPLPTAVWSAVAGLRGGGEASPRSAVIAPSPAGPVRVEASPSGEPGSVAVVLTPQQPPPPLRAPESWALTDQEQHVVALLLRGLGNRRIAEALTVSDNTVEWHCGACMNGSACAAAVKWSHATFATRTGRASRTLTSASRLRSAHEPANGRCRSPPERDA